MGLDMYAYRVHSLAVIDDFSFERFDDDADFKLHGEFKYWRKNNALHAWMEKLYREKGGTKESFNCVPLRLTKEDIHRLEDDIRGWRLQPKSGFFWGELTYDEEMRNGDLDFVADALRTIESGHAVYYDSWW